MNTLLRWYLKKLGRKSLIFVTKGMTFLENYSPSIGVRVLTYHKFGKKEYDPFCLDTREFEEQLKLIKSSFIVMSYEDFLLYIRGDIQINENLILITIDDGDVSVYRKAIPLLDKYKIPAIIFVSPEQIESPLKTSSDRKMTWNEIQIAADCGFTIGSHGWSHQSMTSLSIFDAYKEAYLSKKIMEDYLNCIIEAFAYPYGTHNDHNQSTRFILEKTGYKCAFTSQHSVCLPFQSIFTLPRIQIESGEGINNFKTIINGGLDSWWLVQNILFKRRKRNRLKL